MIVELGRKHQKIRFQRQNEAVGSVSGNTAKSEYLFFHGGSPEHHVVDCRDDSPAMILPSKG
jgi:hypothetical protein